LKVLMVFPFEFPGRNQWEGSRSRLLSLSRGLAERGFEVHILSKPDPTHAGRELDGIKLHSFPPYGLKPGGKFAGALLAGRGVEQLARRHDFDVVHCHMPVVSASVALWKPLIGPKTVFDTHDWFKVHDELYHNLPLAPKVLGGAADWLEREIARANDGVLVTTGLLSRLVHLRAKVFVVPNPIDTEHFRPGRSKSRSSRLGGADFVIGFLGSVSVHQGFWNLLEAVKVVSTKVEGVKLLAVGGGFVEAAKEECTRLGIADKVVFTGPDRVPYGEVPDLVNAMDVAVSPLIPSPRYQEYAQPLKVLEYMACEVPTVVTPLAEQSRIVAESDAGVIARGFGGREMADAILEAHSRRDDASRERSRRYVVANHSVGNVTQRLIAAYEALLA